VVLKEENFGEQKEEKKMRQKVFFERKIGRTKIIYGRKPLTLF
jgi:hypothetical protein